MKNCELCKFPARTFCESDQASLCWDCDAKVHGANFLVARHSRTLLCHVCSSPTPWKASGSKLGNTVSVCEGCSGGTKVRGEGEGAESEGDNDDETDREDDDLDEDAVGSDGDGDNQVVPWSSTTPPPSTSSSSSEASVRRCSNGDGEVSEPLTKNSLKRQREDASDHDFQEGPNSLPSRRRYATERSEQVASLAWLSCDGEPSSKELVMALNGGETIQASTK